MFHWQVWQDATLALRPVSSPLQLDTCEPHKGNMAFILVSTHPKSNPLTLIKIKTNNVVRAAPKQAADEGRGHRGCRRVRGPVCAFPPTAAAPSQPSSWQSPRATPPCQTGADCTHAHLFHNNFSSSYGHIRLPAPSRHPSVLHVSCVSFATLPRL